MIKLRPLMYMLLSVCLLSTLGCWKTFHSQRVGDDCKFKGVPTMMHKSHIASVTWSKGEVTQHICTLPVMYAVDVCPAPVGTTEAKFAMAADGQLTEASAKLDQKLPELIKSIGDAAAQLQPASGRSADNIKFTPGIDSTTNPAVATLGHIVNITFQELDQASCRGPHGRKCR